MQELTMTTTAPFPLIRLQRLGYLPPPAPPTVIGNHSSQTGAYPTDLPLPFPSCNPATCKSGTSLPYLTHPKRRSLTPIPTRHCNPPLRHPLEKRGSQERVGQGAGSPNAEIRPSPSRVAR